MTVSKSPSPIHVETSRGDIRTIQRGRTWEQFHHLQQGFENTRGIRLFYYNGTIEIPMPGEAHELFKSIIGFLIETFLFHLQAGEHEQVNHRLILALSSIDRVSVAAFGRLQKLSYWEIPIIRAYRTIGGNFRGSGKANHAITLPTSTPTSHTNCANIC